MRGARIVEHAPLISSETGGDAHRQRADQRRGVGIGDGFTHANGNARADGIQRGWREPNQFVHRRRQHSAHAMNALAERKARGVQPREVARVFERLQLQQQPPALTHPRLGMRIAPLHPQQPRDPGLGGTFEMLGAQIEPQ